MGQAKLSTGHASILQSFIHSSDDLPGIQNRNKYYISKLSWNFNLGINNQEQQQ